MIEQLRLTPFCEKMVLSFIDPYFNYQLFKHRDECNHCLISYCVIYHQIAVIEYFLAKLSFGDLEEEY
jgi:hypothetical protein